MVRDRHHGDAQVVRHARHDDIGLEQQRALDEEGVLVVQDQSGVELLQVGDFEREILPGARIRIHGWYCLLRKREMGIELSAEQCRWLAGEAAFASVNNRSPFSLVWALLSRNLRRSARPKRATILIHSRLGSPPASPTNPDLGEQVGVLPPLAQSHRLSR